MYRAIARLLLISTMLTAGCSLLLKPIDSDPADGSPDGQIDPDADAPPDAAPDPDARSDADTDRDGDRDVESDRDSDADGGDDAGQDGDVESDADTADVEPVCEEVGHDEDSDGVDDGCDLCPTFPDVEQQNSDGDGLGDACEWPRDGGALDQDALEAIAFFDGFRDFDGTSYERLGYGTESPGVDQYSLRTEPRLAVAVYVRGLALEPPYSIEARFRDGTLGTSSRTGVVFGDRTVTADRHWWYCAFQFDSGQLQLWRYRGVVELLNVAGTEDSGAEHYLRRIRVLVRAGGAVECTLADDTGPLGRVTYTPQPGDDFSGLAGLRVYNMHSAFQSVVFYQ